MKPVKTLILAMFLVATSLANAFPIVYSLSGIGAGMYTSDGVSRSFMGAVFNLVMYGDTDSLTTGTLPTVPGSQIGESWVTQANLNRIVAVVNTSPNSGIPPAMAAASPGDFQLVSRMVDGHQLANGTIVNPTTAVGLCANSLDQVACFSGSPSTEFGLLTEPGRLTLASAYQSTSLQWIRPGDSIDFMTTNGGELRLGLLGGNADRPLTFSVSPVPEPSTYAMLFAGLLAVGYFLRNKGRRSLAVRGFDGQMMPCFG